MIKRIRIQNYKALRDVTLDLRPIHVLIGPNDSGKTSILEAIAAICRSVDHPLSEAFVGSWDGYQLVWMGKQDLPVRLTASIEVVNQSRVKTVFEYLLSTSFAPSERNARVESEEINLLKRVVLTQRGNPWSQVYLVTHKGNDASDDVREAARVVSNGLKNVHSYRWDAQFLSLPVALDANRQFRMESSGFGLAQCLEDILGHDPRTFLALEKRFCEIFPHVSAIRLKAEPAYKSPVDDPTQVPTLQKQDGKGIYFKLSEGGDDIPARQASDGTLLILAYLVLLHLPQAPRTLLIEEPENGIHPNRLKSVLSILRELIGEQDHTQVILTTHSPYAVDLFAPEEVTLCQKQKDGSISVRRLSESQAVRDQQGVFTLGEIWTSEGDESLSQPALTGGSN